MASASAVGTSANTLFKDAAVFLLVTSAGDESGANAQLFSEAKFLLFASGDSSIVSPLASSRSLLGLEVDGV